MAMASRTDRLAKRSYACEYVYVYVCFFFLMVDFPKHHGSCVYMCICMCMYVDMYIYCLCDHQIVTFGLFRVRAYVYIYIYVRIYMYMCAYV